jgi:hypothetical protein
MPVTKKSGESSVPVMDIPETTIGQIEVGVLSITPYLHNRMAEKARQELLYPKGRKNAAEKASTLKHEPIEEFRSSPYTMDDENSPTLLAAMASSFKGAMMTAALDLPGSSKTQIGRLVWVEGYRVPMWGTAKLHMSVTRSADMARTPDIRTRAISPEWASIITISYVKPLVTEKAIINLLSTGGRSAGVGDWRPQKGKGTFGQFRLVNVDDPDLREVMKLDRAIQVEAMEAAESFDGESAELLGWYISERKERGR